MYDTEGMSNTTASIKCGPECMDPVAGFHTDGCEMLLRSQDALTAIARKGDRVIYFSWASGQTYEMSALGASYHGIDLSNVRVIR